GARVRRGELARRLDRRVERGAIDDEEAEELLLGLGEWAVDDERLLPVPGQRRRRRRGQEAGDRAQPTLLGPPLLGRPPLHHPGVVLLLAPGTDDVFGVVTKDRVEHAVTASIS